MKVYNPTYNNATNKIVAYLLHEPKKDNLEGKPNTAYWRLTLGLSQFVVSTSFCKRGQKII